MELRQLAVAVAVAEEGGFTAAAQRLRTVQSTVSTVVRALERDLGTPLFHRTTHRVVLTPAGEAFVPAARAALAAADRARAAVSPVGGCVRVGVCPGLLANLPGVLAGLRSAHPGVVVEVRQVAGGEAGCAVLKSFVDVVLTAAGGGSDAAAGSAPLGNSSAPSTVHVEAAANGRITANPLATTPLPAEELVLATAPGGSRSAPADLSDLALVDFPLGWAIRQAVDQAFPRRRVTIEVDDLATAAAIVRAGIAACVLPHSAAARFPDLTVRRFGAPPPWQVVAVHRAQHTSAVAAVLGQLG